MGKSASDVNRTVQKHSPSSLSEYRLSINLSKINNEEQTNHRRTPCANPLYRLNRPLNGDTDRNMFSASLVKLTPHVPIHYKVYGPQRKYELKSATDAHNFMYANAINVDRQNAQNNNHHRPKIDRWTAESLVLLRGDHMSDSSIAAHTDNGNHLIDLNEAANSRITCGAAHYHFIVD